LPLFGSFNWLFIIVGILVSLCVAISDAILDSLAVDITPQKRRGTMQGVGWGGRGLGMAIAGYFLGIVIANDKLGWRVGIYIPGALIIIACFVLLFFPEPKQDTGEKAVSFKKEGYAQALKNKYTWIVTTFMLLSGTGITVVSVLSSFLKGATNLEIEGIGLGVTIFALGMFVGTSIIGVLEDHLPLFPILVASTVVYGGLIGLMFLIPSLGIYTVYAIVVAIGAINGGYEATQMRIGMEHSVGPVAGSLYNWYMSTSNLGQLTLGTMVIANLSNPEILGFPLAMQLATVFLILALIPGWFAIRGIKKYDKEEVPST